MATVGSSEAKTHLPQLLERVARGESITITKHGKPIAVLVPPPSDCVNVEEAIRQMIAFGKARTAGDQDFREMANEGRRF